MKWRSLLPQLMFDLCGELDELLVSLHDSPSPYFTVIALLYFVYCTVKYKYD